MSIKVTCPACDETYRLADDKAGKDVRCKRCNETISVPEPEEERLARLRKKPEKSGGISPGWLIFGGVAGLLLLLACGLVGAVSYAIYSAANAVNKVVDNVNTVVMDFPGAQPKDLNEALQWLAAGGVKGENAAAWLEKQPPDPARRAEVIAAIDHNYDSATVGFFAKDTYLNAMAAWAGPNDVPVLVRSLDVRFNPKVLDALVKYKNDEAARGVVKHMDTDMPKASDTLKRMGPVAEDAVADFLLAEPNGKTPKWEALRILKVIGTPKTVPKVQEALRNDKAIDYDANQAIAAMKKR